MPTTSWSISDIRYALRHLYEPRALQESPLLESASSRGKANAAAALRAQLTEAIEALKPGPDAPAQSPARRAYEILYYRYVQQYSTAEVADQIGLSTRHLKREHRKAVERLAQSLAERLGVVIELDGKPARAPSGARPGGEATLAGALQWESAEPSAKTAQLGAVLPAVLDLLQPIAERYDVQVQAPVGSGLPALAVDSVALRQMLLSVLCVGIRQAAGGLLRLSAASLDGQVAITVAGADCATRSDLSAEDAANLDVARQLAAHCSGSLDVSGGADPFCATLTLPGAEQAPVLMVDDHADTLQLLERYLTGTRYRAFPTQSSEQALSLALEVRPQAIVLDVMIPEVDGWELLGRLKQHPQTSNIPVIACTIVAQEELAFSLGVSAFLRKPVSRRSLLAALDRLVPAKT